MVVGIYVTPEDNSISTEMAVAHRPIEYLDKLAGRKHHSFVWNNEVSYEAASMAELAAADR